VVEPYRQWLELVPTAVSAFERALEILRSPPAGATHLPEQWLWAVQTNLARALVSAGRAAEAYEVCVALGSVMPTLPGAHQLVVRTMAGVALSLTGDFGRAYTEFEQGTMAAPQGGTAGAVQCSNSVERYAWRCAGPTYSAATGERHRH